MTLVYGLGTEAPPSRAHLLTVETTEQMYEAVVSELKSKKYDLTIAVAAVADWTPEKPYPHKVSSHELHMLEVKLKPTVKIIDDLKKVSPELF